MSYYPCLLVSDFIVLLGPVLTRPMSDFIMYCEQTVFRLSIHINLGPVHTYPGNSTANPEKINPLSRVEKKTKSATNPITCGQVNPHISDDAKSVSSLLPNSKPIWRHNVEGELSKFPATLYGACSEDIIVQRSLGY